MMNSIVTCAVVSMCAMIAHGGNIATAITEVNMCSLQKKIEHFMNLPHGVVNETALLIDYHVFSKRSRLITKPLFETLDEIKRRTMEAAKEGANKTHCYEAAKLSATTAAKHASDGMTLCGEEYTKIVKADVTLQFDLLKTELARTGYTMYLPIENDIDRTLLTRLRALRIQFIRTQQAIHEATLIASSNNAKVLDSCLGKFTEILTVDLQNVKSHASACI